MHQHIPILFEVEVRFGEGFDKSIHQLPEMGGKSTWAWEHTKGCVDKAKAVPAWPLEGIIPIAGGA